MYDVWKIKNLVFLGNNDKKDDEIGYHSTNSIHFVEYNFNQLLLNKSIINNILS